MGLAKNPTSLHKTDVECTKSLTPEKRLVDRTDFSLLRMKIEDFSLLQPLSIIRSSQTTLNRIHISFFSTVNMVQVQKETKNHGVERQLKRSIIRSKLSRQLQNHMVISWPESRHFWRKTATSNLCWNFSKPPLHDETFEKKANLKKMLKMRRAYAPRTIQKIREILMRISMEFCSSFLGGHLERLWG